MLGPVALGDFRNAVEKVCQNMRVIEGIVALGARFRYSRESLAAFDDFGMLFRAALHVGRFEPLLRQ
jgi:hypothetical protein